jgi:pyruvate,water dikinase
VPGGGTRQEPLPDTIRRERALDDAQVLALVELGERIERLYDGVPQDIEWLIAAGKVFIVQARPITSLFPIPQSPAKDPGLRVFLSFGHVQMMLDAMPRLAIEALRLFIPVGKAPFPTLRDPPSLSSLLLPTASRIFIDATPILRVRRARKVLLGVLTHGYAELGRAVRALTERPEFAEGRGNPRALLPAALDIVGPIFRRVPVVLLAGDPAVRARRFDADSRRAAGYNRNAKIHGDFPPTISTTSTTPVLSPGLSASTRWHRFPHDKSAAGACCCEGWI